MSLLNDLEQRVEQACQDNHWQVIYKLMHSCDQCNILLHIEEYKATQILRIHYERLAHRYLRESIQNDIAWTYSAYLVNKEQADRYKYQMNNLCCKRCRRILDITRQKEEVFTKEIEKWQERLLN